MEPAIRHATTIDGVDIAYFAIGSGPALASFTLPVSHLQFEWQYDPHARALFDLASSSWTFVRFNSRGFGMSERNVSDFSLSQMACDLEAVADALQLETFDLLAANTAVPIAITYVANHPGRIQRLVLSEGSAVGANPRREALDKLVGLAESDWRLVSEAVTHHLAGWGQPGRARDSARLLRASVGGGTYAAFYREVAKWDVTDLLPRITIPTLLMYSRLQAEHEPEVVRELVSGLPDAKLAVLEGDSREEFVRARTAAALTFLGEGHGFPAVRLSDVAAEALEHSRQAATILFADIVESTALTLRLGDVVFRERARNLDGTLRRVVRDHGGRPVEGKLLGDGVLAVFTSATEAIEAALSCGRAGEDAGLSLHLGLHTGDVIHEANDVHGGAVSIASRISDLSAPGEVLVSDIVRGLASTSAGVRFEDRGEQSLKGVGEPMRLWAVQGAADRGLH